MKKRSEHFIKTPWDSKIFGMDTYEIRTVSRKALERARKMKGHFTVKVDPLSSKKLLYEHGFYYCDTLIEPFCARDSFKYFKNSKAAIAHKVDIDKLVNISHGAFYGRFHRDFNISKRLADLRYDTWLKNLHKEGNVFGLIFDGKVAGFFGFSRNKIVLHAISEKFRGKGLARYLWSVACKELFRRGYKEISSSVSASNAAVLNLYSSLGFRFRNPRDVYHGLFR